MDVHSLGDPEFRFDIFTEKTEILVENLVPDTEYRGNISSCLARNYFTCGTRVNFALKTAVDGEGFEMTPS